MSDELRDHRNPCEHWRSNKSPAYWTGMNWMCSVDGCPGGELVTLRQVSALVAIDLPDELRQPGFVPHEERMLYEIVEDTDD